MHVIMSLFLLTLTFNLTNHFIIKRLTSDLGRKIKTESFLVVPNDSLTTVYELTFCEYKPKLLYI